MIQFCLGSVIDSHGFYDFGRVDYSTDMIGTLSFYFYENYSPVGKLLGNFVACPHAWKGLICFFSAANIIP